VMSGNRSAFQAIDRDTRSKSPGSVGAAVESSCASGVTGASV
jgi:hypothetical protein